MSSIERVYSALVTRSPEAEQELAPDQQRNIARNGLRLVLASTLQASGDQTVKASTVLPWLFHALGVPPALTGLLVPIRESGSMLPQAFLTPLILRFRRRKWVFILGALIQALSVGAMAASAALGSGLAAGIAILIALTVFSLGRSLGSITSKDIQGRTVPKGERGQINGLSTTASGLVVITVGLTIHYLGGDDLSGAQLAWLVSGGAVAWIAVAIVYAGIREPAQDGPGPGTARGERNWLVQTIMLLRDDRPFRRFVLVRSLLLVSALSPPFVVTLAAQSGDATLAGLAGYIVASGVAALVGGRLFGRFADRSSHRLMGTGSAIASITIVVLVVAVSAAGTAGTHPAVFITAYFTLTLVHTGVRVGRKTYVVDMAEGDLRTTYVAVSNSAMGLILLLVGAVSSGLAALGINWALLFLAAMGLLGTVVSAQLPRVSRT